MAETLFKEVRYDLQALMKYIELGEIGLPNIQRPFVWKNAKVRDLFDSMYRGYPVGYLLFWQNGSTDDVRLIGVDQKQKPPRLLIVDGQQRLTSLYAVTNGIPVVRENFKAETIEIAFNPILERFEVADAAIRRDTAFLPNISVLWGDRTDLFDLVDEYLKNLEAVREVSEHEKRQIRKAIQRVNNLTSFPFTALELSSQIDEDQVSEVFVRVNSKGTPLNQADFILTLMSVFRDDKRAELEEFCRLSRRPSAGEPSPFNHYLQPDPDQLLRVGVGVGFKRARLQHVYSILRGKDLETGEFSSDRREAQFGVLERAQSRVLNLQHWHDFFKAIRLAGYLGGRLISSHNGLLFTYVFYLLGRTEYQVDEHTLRQVIARWFFMASLTGRYTSSPESALEFDLAKFRGLTKAEEFVAILDVTCDATLTNDYWAITLPNDLATSSAVSPSLYAYYAALVLLDAKALFSANRVVDLLDPSVHGTRAAVERHHLFPRAHLDRLGVTELREVNQIANFALAEWNDNADIADRAPSDYLPGLRGRVDQHELEQIYYWHALPDGWEALRYGDFLTRRRELIARVIRDAYGRLRAGKTGVAARTGTVPVEALVGAGESTAVEFKATLRRNLHTGEDDHRIEAAVLKTVAGFLNTKGGTLVIGVSDDGAPRGLEADDFGDEDKMGLHLVNLIRDHIGPQFMIYVHPRFEDLNDHRVLVVECGPGRSPAYMRDGSVERFFVRTGAATTELSASQTQEFIRQRF